MISGRPVFLNSERGDACSLGCGVFVFTRAKGGRDGHWARTASEVGVVAELAAVDSLGSAALAEGVSARGGWSPPRSLAGRAEATEGAGCAVDSR